MKSKFFLRGLGTGIVLATLVCLIAFNVDRSKAALEEKSTKEQTTIFDEESSDDTDNSEKEESTEEIETKEEITTPEAVTVPEIETEIPELETTTFAPTPASNGSISILPGMTSEAVSDLLQSNGVINDANDFNSFLTGSGYATTIHVGTFDIPAGSDYESIARIIAGR